MLSRPEKQGQPGLDDPRLEFARLVSERGKPPAREENLSDRQPPAVDADFCFDEESQ